MRSIALLLVLATALAGCGGGGGDDGTTTGTATGTGTGTTTGTTTGGNGTGAPEVGSCTGSATAAVVLTGRMICDFSEAGSVGGAQNAVVELTWTTLQPGSLEVILTVETDECNQGVQGNACTIAEDSGDTAPLRVQLDAGQLAEIAGDNPAAYGGITGAGQQELTVYISLFPGAVPDGYTAVP